MIKCRDDCLIRHQFPKENNKETHVRISKPQLLQDQFLDTLRKAHMPLLIYLIRCQIAGICQCIRFICCRIEKWTAEAGCRKPSHPRALSRKQQKEYLMAWQGV